MFNCLSTTLTTQSPSLFLKPKPLKKLIKTHTISNSYSNSNSEKSNGNPNNPLLKTLKTTALILSLASCSSKLKTLPVLAHLPKPPLLTHFLDTNIEAIDALKRLLQTKLESGEDEEALKIVHKLTDAQPDNNEWRFLRARILSEIGSFREAREVFEELLERNPLSYEALFENALLMDRSGESDAVMSRLEEALKVAVEKKKVKEARDVRLIMAQVEFLHKNIEGALKSYDALVKEDPKDFRPYFCKGMIYSLLDKNTEAREQFAKYRELSPKKFDVEGYLRTPLSKMKLFGPDEPI